MNSLTKGDRIKVINNSNVKSVPLGTTGVVREVTDRDPQLLIVQLDTGFKVLLYDYEVALLPPLPCDAEKVLIPRMDADDVGYALGDDASDDNYDYDGQHQVTAEPADTGPSPDEIMDITRSFCR